MIRLASIVLVLISATVPPLSAAPARPNIVLILADDMGAETIGAYGGTSYATPNIDALAREGIRFDHAYSQPLCTPSRLEIMTGKSNVRNYVGFEFLPKGQPTFANYLRDAGYRTFIAGKWQLSRNVAGSFGDPVDFGFDEYFLWQLDRRPRRYYAPGFEALIPSAGFRKERVDYPASAENFGPDLVVSQINDFITRNTDRPFFIYYPMMLPHDPFVPTPDHPKFDPTAKTEPNKPAYFKAMAEYADKMVGRVMDHLDASNLADNTLVIFCGDNGTLNKVTSMRNGEPVRGGKGDPTNAGTHVPFVVRWPGHVAPGKASASLVNFTDVLPTLLEAAGAPVPEGIDGVSLLPELTGNGRSPRQWSYSWYMPRNDDASAVTESVRDTRYRLYRSGAFFDLQNDRLEKSPLDVETLTTEEQAAYDVLAAALGSFDDELADRNLAPRLAANGWEVAPEAGAEPGSAKMTVAEAVDANGPVEYQLENRKTGSQSAWQTERTFSVTGLASGSQTFRYRARDLLGNLSPWSPPSAPVSGGE